MYSQQTKFVSDPTTQSSIIGIDFYMLREQGPQYGPYGQLFPLSDPQGSGFMRCTEDELNFYSTSIQYLQHAADFSDENVVTLVIDYEIKKGIDHESDAWDTDCTSPTKFDYNLTTSRTPEWNEYDKLSLKYTVQKAQLSNYTTNVWDALQFCQAIRLIDQEEQVLVEELIIISQMFSK